MLASILAAATLAATPVWKPVQAGVDYATLPLGAGSTAVVHVVRVDPSRARLAARFASTGPSRARTAAAWCEEEGLAVAINLGMYQEDLRSNVGYARADGHVNHGRWVSSYKSAIAFGPKRKGLPPAAMVDLDAADARRSLDDYDAVIQNLRLLKGPGVNVWAEAGERWVEAAIAADREGRILFLFVPTAFSMRDLNARLLALPLGIVRAMHAEGGSEASLSIRGNGLKVDLSGSGGGAQWPIPNVLGVLRQR
jgi:hypothetical protein